MHIFLLSLVIVIAIKKANWSNWESYYPTMLYISLASFLYEYISHTKFHLWDLKEDSFLSHMNVHFVHNLLINPLIAFIFLSQYPQTSRKQIMYTIKWVIVFLLAEWVIKYWGVLDYYNGWHLGWSFLFIVFMFPMIRLHYLHPIRALSLSVIFVVFYLSLFHYI